MQVGTEPIPVFKSSVITSLYSKHASYVSPETGFEKTQDVLTRFDERAGSRAASGRIDRQSRLWIKGLISQKNRPALARIYLALAQCLYQDPAAGTSCVLPSEEIAVSRTLFETYLDRLVNRGNIASEIRDSAYRLWGKLHSVYPGLSEPDAAPSPDNGLMLAFDDGLNHLEFEIFERDRTEVYFLKRDTNEMWEDEIRGEESLSVQLLTAVGLFSK